MSEPQVGHAQFGFAFHMGRAAGVADRVGLARISKVLIMMGRMPTELYEMPAGEAHYMREALELMLARWLPIELRREQVSEAHAAEIRGALESAIDVARAIEASVA